MKANIYKITKKPQTVNFIDVPGIKHEEARTYFKYRSPWALDSNKLYFLGDSSVLTDADQTIKSEEMKNLPLIIQRRILNLAIEKLFASKGFYLEGKKRSVYVTANKPIAPLIIEKRKIQDQEIYINDAIRFNMDDTAEEDGIDLLPTFTITTDGTKSDKETTEKYHSAVNITKKYNDFLQARDRWKIALGNQIQYSFDGGEEIEISLNEFTIAKEDTHFYPEPEVAFHQSGDMAQVWPYMGLKKFHPLDHNLGISSGAINVALIGTGMSFELLKEIKNGDGKNYPGFQTVFKSTLNMGQERVEKFTPEELMQCKTLDEAKALYMQALETLIGKKEKFDVLLVELPEEIRHLFIGQETDFRDYLKVAFLEKRIPTQFITHGAVESTDTYKYMDLALGIYVSAGGIPWKLKKQPVDTCFMGISFGIKKTKIDSKILVGIAEIFDEYGESISIKCVSDAFEEEKGYHISTDRLVELMRTLLQDYFKRYKQFPRHVIVHKTSEFNEAELLVEEKLKDFPITFTFVHVAYTNIRLWPDNDKMPSRGDYWIINDKCAVVYTDGYVQSARMYLGVGAPSPLVIKSYSSNFSIKDLSEQVFHLTKLNWNSTKNHEKLPVTISHANKIVDLLRAGLDASSIISDFRFYR